MEHIKGIITDIQRASVHDGPGMRTTVFLKGCNMHCAWCHNPETIAFAPEMIFYPEQCIKCGQCKNGCYTGARVLCGREVEAEEILDIVEEDTVYYDAEGGMTVSGGEPSAQAEFLKDLLRKAKDRNISTGIETNLSMEFGVYEDILPYIDWWMVDFKIFEAEKHKKYTGTSNERIIENIKKLDCLLNHNLILRTPVIKEVNDGKEELEQIVRFSSERKNLIFYEILPYHPLGLSKNVKSNMYIRRFETPDKEVLRKMAVEWEKKYGIKIKISNISI